MDHPFINPRIISYCTGFRGLERGIERAIGAIRTITYVEIEAFIIENLLCAMQTGKLDAAPIWANIKTFNAEPFRNKIHGIIGGYPCQPFSMAGNRKGTDDPRHLWPYLERDISAIRPIWCFFENVSGHLSLGFQQVRQSLSDLGYSVEAGIFTAAEVGAPHQRERLFILAIRRDFLGNANSTTNRNEQSGLYPETARTSENELAYTCNIGCQHRRNNWQKRHIQRNIWTAPKNKSEWKRWERGACKACENLARRKERKLEHSTEQGLQISRSGRKWKLSAQSRKGFHHRSEQSGSEYVGNANLSIFRKTCGKFRKISSKVTDNSNTGSNEILANTNSSGSREYSESSKLWTSSFIQPPFNSRIATKRENNQRGFDRWPARPGEPQQPWESPRTEGYTNRLPGSLQSVWSLHRKDFAEMLGEEVWEKTDRNLKANVESKVGCTIDGHNFREDLLRAYGNGVVEQTAELAFSTLLNQF